MCVVRRQLSGVSSLFLPCELELRWSALAESVFLHSHLPGLTRLCQVTVIEQRNTATCLRFSSELGISVLIFSSSHKVVRSQTLVQSLVFFFPLTQMAPLGQLASGLCEDHCPLKQAWRLLFSVSPCVPGTFFFFLTTCLPEKNGTMHRTAPVS